MRLPSTHTELTKQASSTRGADTPLPRTTGECSTRRSSHKPASRKRRKVAEPPSTNKLSTPSRARLHNTSGRSVRRMSNTLVGRPSLNMRSVEGSVPRLSSTTRSGLLPGQWRVVSEGSSSTAVRPPTKMASTCDRKRCTRACVVGLLRRAASPSALEVR